MTDDFRPISPGWLSLILLLIGGLFPVYSSDQAPAPPPEVEVLQHEWRADAVWERIGKTKFIWSATIRNHSDTKKRVFVYYDLLDDRNHPLASNVVNKMIGPKQTADLFSDSYINTDLLPKVRSSRATVKVGFPN